MSTRRTFWVVRHCPGAASEGYELVVRLLLKTGRVDVDSKNSDGFTPLSRAAMNGHEAVVRLLLGTGKL
jgi:ankyrin repeat protein